MKPLKRPLVPVLILAMMMWSPAGRADTTLAQAPDAALKGAVDQVQAMVKRHYAEYKADQTKFVQVLNDVVVPRFDVEGISRLVLGAHYRSASPDQRSRFAAAFTDMLVRTYANTMLDNYKAGKLIWMTPRLSADGTDATVNTTLTLDNGQSFFIDFRLHRVEDDWKVLDISVEEISLVLNFRTQFNAEIRRSNLDDVITRMQNGQLQPSGEAH
jgi:phospholipid transport system substrate-binding protein